MKKLILASTSLGRKEILAKTGLRFGIIKSNYKEDMSRKVTPSRLAEFLSFKKAEAVVKNCPKSVIIGADTFIVLGNKLLGKPHTPKEAFKMLRKINGKTLEVITGFTIIDADSNKKISRSVSTKVFIKKLSKTEISNYVKTKEPLDKAGAFGIQGKGALLIKKIEGDYFNVIGLPLNALVEELRRFGFKVL
jgi:septum formation protein